MTKIWLRPKNTFLLLSLSALLSGTETSWAQNGGNTPLPAQTIALEDSVRGLETQVRELRAALEQMRAETARYRAETLQLRRDLSAIQVQARESSAPSNASIEPEPLGAGPHNNELAEPSARNALASRPPQDSSRENRLAKLEEEYQLLTGKVDEQYQTKVESASKYRVRLSGVVLLNLFNNFGTLDTPDFSSLALARGTLDSGGSFGGTVRQSQIGLEVFGPNIAGAKTAADVQLDFAGGFPTTFNGISLGLVRLRTGTLRLDWPRTSMVAGQDALFFSPLSPTSLASLAVPALSYSGNLWAWTPQIRVERRLEVAERSSFLVQGGILAPLTGEAPSQQFSRPAQAGERARMPAYAARVSWSVGTPSRPITFGVAAYYGRQNWGFERNVDAWAGMTDWSLPLGQWFGLTGKFYRGRAIGGLAGGLGRSVVFNAPLTGSASIVKGLNSTGGWSQLKFTARANLEFNGAFGMENSFASDFRQFPVTLSTFFPTGLRNRSAMANFIYRPRSDFLLSVEYRRLHTFELGGRSQTADQINLSMGILF